MAHEEEKDVARRCFTELWGEGWLDVAAEILSPGYAGHAPGDRTLHGRDALKALVRAYRSGFPGLQISVIGQIGELDRVVTEFTMSGIHAGKWFGVPATGRQVELGCVAFSVVRDGLITEQWYEWERRKLLEQLKLVPVLAG